MTCRGRDERTLKCEFAGSEGHSSAGGRRLFGRPGLDL